MSEEERYEPGKFVSWVRHGPPGPADTVTIAGDLSGPLDEMIKVIEEVLEGLHALKQARDN